MIMKIVDLRVNTEAPWVRYRTLKDLLGLGDHELETEKARAAMVAHPQVAGLIAELQGWPGTVLSSHKSAGQYFHKLVFLADLGLNRLDAGIPEILEKVLQHRSEEGLPLLSMKISAAHGGTEEEVWGWALCDAPVSLYGLARMGLAEDPRVLKGRDFLIGLVRDNGWPCKVSETLGSFRGPGRKGDPCPYATMAILKLLSLYDETRNGREARLGVECLLSLWVSSAEQHPYMFYMGTDFRKLKAPLIWYDIVHVLDVLSRFEYAVLDPRFLQMLEVVTSKADSDGLYTPESVWQAWKDWDFGQKKKPSLWLTYLVMEIQHKTRQSNFDLWG
jgi:hypothetical protein